MKIALHRESRAGETRVALTPDAVKTLVNDGWEVEVQRGAGIRAHFTDDAYLAVGLEGERGRDAHALVQALQPALGAPLAAGAQIDAALAQARSLAQGGDRVVVLGSFHVVGPALQWLRLYLKSWS